MMQIDFADRNALVAAGGERIAVARAAAFIERSSAITAMDGGMQAVI